VTTGNKIGDRQSTIGNVQGLTIWTIGHSTRTAEEFGKLLLTHSIQHLIDVRSFPGSRRLPQFNKAALENYLATIGVAYHHMPKLGGRRRPQPDSKNTAWLNASFRAYADHMSTDEFAAGVKELLEVVREDPTAVMCAEALWWRCHRGLISDYLKSEGATVIHILSETKTETHPYTVAARIIEGRLSYEGLL
jgi:uncharacterized protein (DUF488 family)